MRLSPRVESVLLIGASTLELATLEGLDGPRLALCCAAVAALLLRRRWPVAVLLVTLPAAALGLLLLAPMSAMYQVARDLPRLRTVLVCAALLGCAGVAVWWWPDGGPVSLDDRLFGLLHGATFAGGPAAVGRLVRARGELSSQLEELKRSRERERLLLAETAVAEERARLAREMHDVVSHQVSLITVQAGALEATSGEPAAREVAATIRGLGVATLDELRVMVGVLRRDAGAGGGPDGDRSDGDRSDGDAGRTGTDPADPAGAPGLAGLARLVADSGLRVRYAPGSLPPGPWPEAAQLTVYRTVQEALTNVRKYAPAAEVELTVRVSVSGSGVPAGPSGPGGAGAGGGPGPGDMLVVEVANGPSPQAGAAGRSGGFGLLGLRERAEQLGGTLLAGPDGRGGFRVRAELPRSPVARRMPPPERGHGQGQGQGQGPGRASSVS